MTYWFRRRVIELVIVGYHVVVFLCSFFGFLVVGWLCLGSWGCSLEKERCYLGISQLADQGFLNSKRVCEF